MMHASETLYVTVLLQLFVRPAESMREFAQIRNISESIF